METVLSAWIERDRPGIPGGLRQDLWLLSEFFAAFANSLDPGSPSMVKLHISKRQGRPARSTASIEHAIDAARRVELLVDRGWKQEAAIVEVSGATNVGRTVLFETLRHLRSWNAFAKSLSGISPGK